MSSISSVQNREKNGYFTDFFFITRYQYGNCLLMWREKENIFCQEVDVEKNLEDVTTEARCIVQHPGFDETREGCLRLHLFCYKTSPHSASQVFIFFGLHPVVSVNAAKNGTVLDNLSVNIIYIYIYIYIYIPRFTRQKASR